MSVTKGIYVVCEGGDGSGKTTQVNLLAARLTAEGLNPLVVDEPYEGNPFGVLLRQIAKTGKYPESRAPLFLACRAALQAEVIVPALAEGRPVISSRNFMSTLVYQQDQHPLEWLISIHTQLPAKPTHLIVLDIEANVGMERVGKRKTQEVYEKLDVAERARARYRSLLEDPRVLPLLAEGCRRKLIWTGMFLGIDSMIDVNAEEIWGIVSPHGKAEGPGQH